MLSLSCPWFFNSKDLRSRGNICSIISIHIYILFFLQRQVIFSNLFSVFVYTLWRSLKSQSSEHEMRVKSQNDSLLGRCERKEKVLESEMQFHVIICKIPNPASTFSLRVPCTVLNTPVLSPDSIT